MKKGACLASLLALVLAIVGCSGIQPTPSLGAGANPETSLTPVPLAIVQSRNPAANALLSTPASANSPVTVPTDAPRPPVTSGSLQWQDCLRQELGDAMFNTLTQEGQPNREQLDLIRPCRMFDSGAGGPGGETFQGPQPVFERFNGCSGSGPVDFEYSPMRFEDFSALLPYGLVVGAHVTPIDHMYFSMKDRSLGRDSYEVRAVQDGVIYNLQPRDIHVDTGQSKEREWRMDIAHTCTFHSYFDLLTSLEPSLLAEWEKTAGGRTGRWSGIPIMAGQVVGKIGGQTLDFGVYDYETVLPGFIFPEHYVREPWKIHTVDPFPYFPPAIREVFLERNIRKVEPLAGKIDHDIDGTLSGNWFEKGTDWYAGVYPRRYWDGHLSVTPDFVDPARWIFSIGHWPGENDGSGAAGYLILDAGQDPRRVTAASGTVKYELGYKEYCLVEEPERCSLELDGKARLFAQHKTVNVPEPVTGVVLLHLVEARLLKVEVFPGKTAAEIDGFTAAAKLYER